MKTLIRLLLVMGYLQGLPVALASHEFIAICYHDVHDKVERDLDRDQFAVSTEHLAAHFMWLKAHGYVPVSISDLLEVKKGSAKLPEKAVLLTFDDGYKSLYTRVFPLLKLFNYPAVAALVGSWMGPTEENMVHYGDRLVPRSAFISWQEAREMQASGLVEFASHSFDLHRGVMANPQGSLQPAATTHIYQNDIYEDGSGYRARLKRDLDRNARLLKRELGVKPRVMVWPYGKYNEIATEIAASAGMPIIATLDDTPNQFSRTSAIPRLLIEGNPSLSEFVEQATQPSSPGPMRAVYLDLDDVYDPDSKQSKHNLDLILEHIKYLEISHVFLKAFQDADRKGTAEAVYFPSHVLPVRAELFNWVAWQLKTRAGVEVYAWLPLSGFKFPDYPGAQTQSSSALQAPDNEVRRQPPSLSQLAVKNRITELYRELAAYGKFDGLLFRDHIETQKFNALTEFSLSLAAEIKKYHPKMRVARSISFKDGSDIAPQTESDRALARYFELYDYVILSSMSSSERIDNEGDVNKRLIENIAISPQDLKRTVVELQTTEDAIDGSLSSQVMLEQLHQLRTLGVRNFAYQAGGLLNNPLVIRWVRKGLSLATYPYHQTKW